MMREQKFPVAMRVSAGIHDFAFGALNCQMLGVSSVARCANQN
jgi:hypothetical protein